MLLITRREIKIGGSTPSPFVVQLPFQMINLQLHGSGILLMRDVAPISRLSPASMGDMHTNFLVSSLLKIEKMILMLGLHRFLPIRT